MVKAGKTRSVSASSNPNPPELTQPCLSRVKARSSLMKGCKFGCVCSYMAGVISRQRNDWPYRDKHTQICTLLLGMTALGPYSKQGCAGSGGGLELAERFSVQNPVLLFLGVFVSLVFFLHRSSLVFLECFLLILQGFQGFAR